MPVPYWDDQRILLAVLRAGSLLGAARVLGVSQPTIRRRIEALEIALGVALLLAALPRLYLHRQHSTLFPI